MCALHASPTSGVVRLSSASRAGARARAAPRACALPPRRGLRRVRVRCASEGADAELAAVQRALSANAAQLDNPSAPQALPQDAALALAQLVEEERRLASLEAELASAEQGITARERELLAKLLARQRLQQLQPSTSELQTRLESTEAEAAALRALVTAGRADSGSLLEPVVVDAPSVRQVMDWEDVNWTRLSWGERVRVWADIVVGKTLDEWRYEWALSKAEGFGLKGLSTLALAATVLLCIAYSLLATVSGGLGSALAAKPFALPTSTLLVLVRVLLSSALLMVEQLCTLIYYTPAVLVFATAAAVLLYRNKCRTEGQLPFWAKPRTVRPSQQVVLLKKVPAPLVPPVYYKGMALPDAIAQLATRPGSVWPPKPQLAREAPKVPFTLAQDVQRLLYGGLRRGGASEAMSAAAAAPAGPPPAGASGGEDWRLAQLEGSLGRARKGVGKGATAAQPRPGASLSGFIAGVAAAAQGDTTQQQTDSGEGAMAALRGRFATMQSTLREGAQQAAEDAADRR